MFILEDNYIYANRGDIVFFGVTAKDIVNEGEEGAPYHFRPGDIVRITVYGKKDAETVYLEKDFPVLKNCEIVEIYLTEEDTKFGDLISKPTDYWYEVVLNPDTNPQTIIGYSDEGPAVFRLFPEGAELEKDEHIPTEEDIPFVDEELDLTSPRPVSNQAVTAALEILRRDTKKDYVTPQMFGAVGDGVADDTEAFKQALEHNCFIPEGTYLVSETLTVTHDLIGFSKMTAVIVPNGCDTVFEIKDRVSATLNNMNIIGNGTETAFSFERVRNSSFADIRVENCAKAFWFVDGCWANTFSRLAVYNCGKCFYNESEAVENLNTTILRDCYIGTCNSAFEITGGSLDVFGGWIEKCDKVFGVTNKVNVMSVGCVNVDFENNVLLLEVGGGSHTTNINRFSFKDCPFVDFDYWFKKTTSANVTLYFDVNGSMVSKPLQDIFTADSLWCYWGTNLPEYYLKKTSPYCLYKAKISAYYNETSIPVELIVDGVYLFPEQVYLASINIPAGTSVVVHGWNGELFTWTLTGDGEFKAVTRPCYKLVFSEQPTQDVGIKVPRNASVFVK